MYPNLLYYSTTNGFSLTEGDPIITSYGLMLMLAFLVCNYLLKKECIKRKFNEQIADDIILYAAIGGLLGSKIYYSIEEGGGLLVQVIALVDLLKGVFSFDATLIRLSISELGGGLTFLGGLIGGTISVSYYIIKKNLNWLEIADLVAPFLILGHAIGRIGCFLVGDCYGKPTDLPWGMSFPLGSPPTNDFVHPTQLYEVMTGFIIFYYLTYLRNTNGLYKGQVFFEYMFLAGLARFIVEFLRVNPHYFENNINLSGAQFISISMIVLSSVFMYYYRKKIKID